MKIEEIEEAIYKLNTKEDIEQIAEAIRLKRRTFMMRQFRIGDTVTWDYRGKEHKGKIMKINRKTVNIRENNGRDWRITPNYLTLEK